jgi:MFS family permease
MKERPIYNALMGLCWGTGCILGPLIGGGFAVSSATWRWAFYINLPLAAATSPIYVFLFPKYNPKSEVSGWTKLKQIDWVGAAFNASLFTLFQIVLTFSGSTWKWNSAGPITIWILLGLIMIAWGFQQTYSIFTTPEHRLFPVQFVRSRSMLLLFIATAGTSTGMSVAVYFLPLFFQFTRGDSAIQAAVRLLPFICIFIFFVMLSGALLPVIGRYQPFYIISGIFLVTGAALMHTVNASTSTSEIYSFEVLMAIGAGFTMQSGYSIAAAKVQEHEIQSAIGFINVAQIGTGAICLSIAGNIFQNVGFINVRNALASYSISESEIRAALGGAQSVILSSTGDATMRKLALDAIIQTMQSIWILSLTGGAVVLVCGILMRPEKLNLSMTAGG